MSAVYDIGILGSGPAALAIAGCCAERGASVALMAPKPFAAWKPNYCMWADEVPAELAGAVSHRWNKTSVVTEFSRHDLNRSYAKLDTAAFQAALCDKLRSNPVHVEDAEAVEVAAGQSETSVLLSRGDTCHARVVVDATGARTDLTRRVHRRPPAFQTAYGLLLEAPTHGFDPDKAVLMDFRPAPGTDTEPASFLYALPLGENLFVEETFLARRPAGSEEVLRHRLQARLTALGLDACKRIDEEHCSIAMGLGLPTARQSVVPFGAAAAMVHPATGYLIARVLRKADAVADALVASLRSDDRQAAVNRANEVLWPREERIVWELYAFGLEALVRMNLQQTTQFFDRFFQLPIDGWSKYLAGTLPPAELLSVMNEFFQGLPMGLRWRLFRTGVSAGAAPLARSLAFAGSK